MTESRRWAQRLGTTAGSFRWVWHCCDEHGQVFMPCWSGTGLYGGMSTGFHRVCAFVFPNDMLLCCEVNSLYNMLVFAGDQRSVSPRAGYCWSRLDSKKVNPLTLNVELMSPVNDVCMCDIRSTDWWQNLGLLEAFSKRHQTCSRRMSKIHAVKRNSWQVR